MGAAKVTRPRFRSKERCGQRYLPAILTAIPLTQAQAAEIDRLLDSGACADPSEVVDAGLKAVAAQMEEWLRREVLPVAQAMDRDPSRAISSEQVFAELRAHHARRLRGS